MPVEEWYNFFSFFLTDEIVCFKVLFNLFFGESIKKSMQLTSLKVDEGFDDFILPT